jgi:hypothetical protein
MSRRRQEVLGTIVGVLILSGIVALGIYAHIAHPAQPFDPKASEERFKKDQERALKEFWEKQNERFQQEQANKGKEGHKSFDELHKGDRRYNWQSYKQLLQNDRPDVRAQAAEALGEIGERLLIVTAREIIDPLDKLPQDSEADRKAFMAAAGQEFFRKRAAEIADEIEAALTAASKDPEKSVQHAATQALAKAKLGRMLLDDLGPSRPSP